MPETSRRRDRKTSPPQNPPSVPAVSQADIARRAYEYYCARGAQHGSALEDWLRAERDLLTAAAPPPAKRSRKPKIMN